MLADCPFEAPTDSADPLVDHLPGQAGLDHGVADGLEAQGPEILGGGVAVELADRPQREAVAIDLARRPAVRMPVELFDVVPEANE